MKPEQRADRAPCRVEISAGGRDITIEAAEPLTAVARKALDLWRGTASSRTTVPPPVDLAAGAGFVLADRSDPAGLMPAELDLPARIAYREDHDVDRHRRTGRRAGA